MLNEIVDISVGCVKVSKVDNIHTVYAYTGCRVPFNEYPVPLNGYPVPLNRYRMPPNGYPVPFDVYVVLEH